MIEFPSHREVEIRVLRIVLSHPRLLAVVPDLEVMDFWDPWHRLLWTAIRNVAELGPVDDRDDLASRCSDWLRTRPGAQSDNAYGIAADVLSGMMTNRRSQAHVLDPMIVQPDDVTPETSLRSELSAAQITLRFSRRARDQMTEQTPRR